MTAVWTTVVFSMAGLLGAAPPQTQEQQCSPKQPACVPTAADHSVGCFALQAAPSQTSPAPAYRCAPAAARKPIPLGSPQPSICVTVPMLTPQLLGQAQPQHASSTTIFANPIATPTPRYSAPPLLPHSHPHRPTTRDALAQRFGAVTGTAVGTVSCSVPSATSKHCELLCFTAPWCGPCQKMKPVIEGLKAQGFKVREINIDAQPGIATRYNVSAIPAFVALHEGKPIGRITGITCPPALCKLMQKEQPGAATVVSCETKGCDKNCKCEPGTCGPNCKSCTPNCKTCTASTVASTEQREFPGAVHVERLVKVTYAVAHSRAEQLKALLTSSAPLVKECAVDGDTLIITAPEPQQHVIAQFITTVANGPVATTSNVARKTGLVPPPQCLDLCQPADVATTSYDGTPCEAAHAKPLSSLVKNVSKATQKTSTPLRVTAKSCQLKLVTRKSGSEYHVLAHDAQVHNKRGHVKASQLKIRIQAASGEHEFQFRAHDGRVELQLPRGSTTVEAETTSHVRMPTIQQTSHAEPARVPKPVSDDAPALLPLPAPVAAPAPSPAPVRTDAWWKKYIMSPKAEEIERNLGIDVEDSGQTLPSAYYLDEDVQYFPTGPDNQFKLMKESLKKQQDLQQKSHSTPAAKDHDAKGQSSDKTLPSDDYLDEEVRYTPAVLNFSLTNQFKTRQLNRLQQAGDDTEFEDDHRIFSFYMGLAR